MKKKILYIDLDGVIVNYSLAEKSGNKGKKGFFLNMLPLPDAIEAVKKLSEKYEVYFLSTAPWSNPDSWKEKRLWVEKYFGELAFKKLILSHNKSLLRGYCLIDDKLANGSDKFKGLFIHYGSKKYPSMKEVLNKLL